MLLTTRVARVLLLAAAARAKPAYSGTDAENCGVDQAHHKLDVSILTAGRRRPGVFSSLRTPPHRRLANASRPGRSRRGTACGTCGTSASAGGAR